MATGPIERRAQPREKPKPNKPAFLSSSTRFHHSCSRNPTVRTVDRPAQTRSTRSAPAGPTASNRSHPILRPHPPSTSSSSSLSSSSSSSTSSRGGGRVERSPQAGRAEPDRARVLPPVWTPVPFHVRRLNLEQVTEMLLALDRIEQDEGLSQELMALEANLLAGVGFRDRHRDMRLDIDDMSYEELLALEEEMGTVSTALPEEKLTKCLQRSRHGGSLHCSAVTAASDDLKCCICQEEYMPREEIGKLSCGHVYHVGCIQQWLRLKNWCPVCKASACPS